MMKRLVLTLAIAGLSGSAIAADLRGPIIEAPPPLPAPAFSWTGAYAGVNVGVGSATPNYSYDTSAQPTSVTSQAYCPNAAYDQNGNVYCTSTTTTGGFSSSGAERFRSGGVLGGVQVGYNYALGLGNFGGRGGLGGFGGYGGFGGAVVPVIGVEADFDGTGIKSGAALGDFASGSLTGTPTYVGVGSELQYFGTVRGRLGLAFDRLLVFGTGGFAYGQVDSYVNSPTNGIATQKSNFHMGYVFGGGVEYAITNNLLLRAEYLHLDLNNKAIAQGFNGTASYDIYEKPSLDLVRAGLSYKFDFARAAVPVVARY